MNQGYLCEGLKQQPLKWLAFGLFVLFLWPMLGALSELYTHHDEFSHGYLVPIISACLAWLILKNNPAWNNPQPLPGLTLLTVGIAVLLMSYWYMIALLPNASLGTGTLIGFGIIINLTGLTLLAGGASLLRALWFPIAYLGFAIPLPSGIAKSLTLRLREIVSSMSEFLLQLINVPVYREGNLLTLENTTLGVADACSGIRSLGILIASAAALAWLFRTGLLRGILLCVLAVAFALASNLIRVTAIALLVIHSGPEWTEGIRHETIGMLAFALSLFALIGMALLFSPSKGESKKTDTSKPEKTASPGHTLFPWGVAVILLSTGILGRTVINTHYSSDHEESYSLSAESHMPLDLFPDRIGNFIQVRKESIPDSQMQVLRPEDSTMRVFQTLDGYWIRFWIFKFLPGSYSPGIHQPDSCYPAIGWEKISEKDMYAEMLGLHKGKVHLRVFEKNQVRRAVLFWFGSDVIPRLPPKGLFPKLRSLFDSWHTIPAQSVNSFILTMETDVEPDMEAAHSRLFMFARQMTPHLRDFGVSWDQNP